MDYLLSGQNEYRMLTLADYVVIRGCLVTVRAYLNLHVKAGMAVMIKLVKGNPLDLRAFIVIAGAQLPDLTAQRG